MIKNNDLRIRAVENKKELKQVFKIRETVFVKEQNVSFGMEKDEFDSTAKHFLFFYKNKPMGCARIRFIGKKAKLERIAILKKYRGNGLGKLLIHHLIRHCKNKGISEIFMNSQYYLKKYYTNLGFKPTGKSFMEAGIKHIKMELTR